MWPYHCRWMWPDSVLMEHSSSPISHSWPLLGDCFLQTIQMFRVQLQIKTLVLAKQFIVDDSHQTDSKTF